MAIVHKLFDIDDAVSTSLVKELLSNTENFAPLKVGFGQYTSQSHGREIIVIRGLTAEHEGMRRPDISVLPTFASGEWKVIARKFPITQQFIGEIAKHLGATNIGKVMFAKIPPGGTMNYHTDSYPLYSGFGRVHIPLVSTSGASSFYTESGNFTMVQHGVYLYDTYPMHTTVNESNADRIHLIIDVYINRATYFPPVVHYWESVKFDNKDRQDVINIFATDEFAECLKKYGTLLFYVGVSDSYVSLLFNSAASKDQFYTVFNIVDKLKLVSHTEVSFNQLPWRDTYDAVAQQLLARDLDVILCRRDYT